MTALKKYRIRFVFLFCLWLLTGTKTFASQEVAPDLPSSGLAPLTEDSSYSRSRGILPAAYDARDHGYVTSVKNQEPWGTCWAFGALSAGETSLIKKGLATNSIDLSELHLSYFFYNTTNDPLGNTKNDSTRLVSSYQNYLEAGGNNLFTMFALAKWTGAASESLAPYSSSYTASLNQNLAYQNTAHLQNARFVDSADVESVKDLILEYGSVSTALYYDPRYLSVSNSYYYPRIATANNHIVTIVGWDDNYETYHFREGYRPSSPGAWIVKNSYGTDFGDNGYFYLSYEDKTLISHRDTFSYAFDMENADNYDHNYQYDGSTGATTFRLRNGGSMANMFTVSGNPGGNEKLEAVSFALYSPNVTYSIQIYKNPDPDDPESGTKVFSSAQKGVTTYSGYYTIPLKKKPVFSQGDTFSVVITFTSADSSYTECFIDYTTAQAGLYFTSKAKDGQSFFKTSKSGFWYDLNEEEDSATARIKAFTTDTASPTTSTGSTNLTTPRITKAASLNYQSAKLTWRSVNGATGYKVYRSASPNGPFRRITTTKQTTFVDSKRTTGATYYYRIRAYKKSGTKTIYSAYSQTKKVTVRLSTPKIKSIQYLSSGKLRLTWKKISGANGYVIYRSSSKNGTYKKLKTIRSASVCRLTTQAPRKGKRYYYKIRAFRKVNGKLVYSRYCSVKGYVRS